MTSYIEAGDRFEARVKKLLKNMGFEKVDGGRHFIINREQIDAIGVFENQIFVVECTTKRTNHKEKIQARVTKRGIINNGLRAENKYKPYKKFRHLYAIDNNSISEAEKLRYADKDYSISILDLSDIKYFEELSIRLPSRAAYDFLSILDIQPPSNLALEVPAIKQVSSGKTIYSFFANPNDVIKHSYVARRDSIKNDYYQRMIDSSRLKSINSYLQEGNFIPTNVVLSINGKTEFKAFKLPDIERSGVTFGMLKLPNSYDSCFVIDGQHRLFSFSKGLKQQLSFLAFDNIRTNEQMKQFVDINDNAKPINSNLMWDLQSDLDENGELGIISRTVKRLNNKDPFRNQIDYPGSTGKKISLSAICIALKKTRLAREDIKNPSGHSMVRNKFFDKDADVFVRKLSDGLAEYFFEFSKTHNEDLKNFITTQGGATVLIYLFRTLLFEHTNGRLAHPVPSSAKYLRQKLETQTASEVREFSRNAATSELNKSKVLNDFTIILSEYEQCLKDHIEDSEKELTILEKEYENLLVEFCDKNLDKPGLAKLRAWFRKGLPRIISKLPPSYTEKDFITKMSIGEKTTLLKIILESKEDLQRFLIREGDETVDANDVRFLSIDEVMATTRTLVGLRNRNDDHHTQLSWERITSAEKDVAQTQYSRLIVCLQQALNDT